MAKYLIKMLSQPSSYAGLSALALSLGVTAPAYQVITTALAAVFGVVAFLMDGNKPTA